MAGHLSRIEATKAAFAVSMSENAALLSGGCACGAVRFETRSAPLRVGLCHCLTCRKAHASAFNPFAVFKAEAVTITGAPRSWLSSPDYDRQFCAHCGSRVIALNGDEVEISLGSLDQTGALAPQYESWVIHREPWLCALDTAQYPQERMDGPSPRGPE